MVQASTSAAILVTEQTTLVNDGPLD